MRPHLSFTLFGLGALALSAAGVRPCWAGEGAEMTAHGNVEWLTAVKALQPRYSPDNPDNTVLNIPQVGALSELRPNLKLDYGSMLRVVLQPRLLAQASQTRVAGAWLDEPTRSVTGEIIQLYAQWQGNDAISLSYGYQNFQWGPAELVSPSNRMFRLVGYLRDPLYVVHGRQLARLNINAGKWLSIVTLIEMFPNSDPAFTYGQPFERNVLSKIEVSAPSGSAYLGVTGGSALSGHPWFGEYAAWSVTDFFSVYADASHVRGSGAWYPVYTETGAVAFERSELDVKQFRTTVVGGLRQSFSQGADIRLEYLHSAEGYDKTALEAAQQIFAAGPPGPDLIGPYLNPGLEILARDAAYLSIRLPNLPPRRRLTVAVRALASLTDRSGMVFGNLNLDLGETASLFFSGTVARGPYYGELSRLARMGGVLGLVYAM
jgi:hypothetical protein